MPLDGTIVLPHYRGAEWYDPATRESAQGDVMKSDGNPDPDALARHRMITELADGRNPGLRWAALPARSGRPNRGDRLAKLRRRWQFSTAPLTPGGATGSVRDLFRRAGG